MFAVGRKRRLGSEAAQCVAKRHEIDGWLSFSKVVSQSSGVCIERVSRLSRLIMRTRGVPLITNKSSHLILSAVV